MNDAMIYYDYTNLQQAFRKQNIDVNDDWLRWCSNIINTKVGQFYYTNLPVKDLDSEIIETAMLFNTNLCYYNSTSVGFGLYRYVPCSMSNKYWKPLKVNILSLTGVTIETDVLYEDIIVVRDTTLNIPPFISLCSWLRKIMTIEKTLDMELLWARIPSLFTGSKEQVLQYKQMIKKAYNFEPFAIGEKGIVDAFKQYDVKMLIDPQELFDLMCKYMDRAVESIGIYSADKKAERLITAEIQAQNDFVDFVYSNMYNERRRAIKQVNEKYDYNIKLHETFVENQEDNLHEEKLKNEIIESIKTKYQKEVEEIKNKGKIEASKVAGVDASKIEAKKEDKNNA